VRACEWRLAGKGHGTLERGIARRTQINERAVVELDSLPQKYNGIYTVMDTGPAVQGRQVDVYMWNCNEVLTFGRVPVHVTVLRLGWNPRATTPSFLDRFFKRPAAPDVLPARPLPQSPSGS